MSKIARVRLPDGRIARMQVPDDATPEQITAQAQRLSAAPKAAPKREGVANWISDNVLSPINEAIIGAPEGIYNAAAAVTDPIAKKVLSLVSGDEAAEAAMSHARGQRRHVADAATSAVVSRRAPVARTAGRIAGSLALPTPKFNALGKLATVTQRAVQGAAGGAAVREVDEDAAAPAAIGAAANIALPPILRILAQSRLGQAVSSGVGKVASPVANYLGAKGDDLVEALLGRQETPLPALQPAQVAERQATSRSLEPLGRKAEARAARFEKMGVQPTAGMVTRDPSAFKTERKLAQVEGAGEELQQQLQAVEQGLVAKGREIVDRMGGAKGPEATGLGAQDVLDTKRGEMQVVTGRMYDKIRDERGDEIVGTLESLNDMMNSPDVTDNATFDSMRDSLSRRMARLGLAAKSPRGVTLKQAEELRKFIRGLGSTADPAVRMMRAKLIDALDDDVVGSVGDDAFKAARASAKARFDEFQKTFAGRVADEGIAPEMLTKRLLSDTTRLDDLRAMKQSLLSGTDEQVARGKEAWEDLQAQAVDDFLKSAVSDEGGISGAKIMQRFRDRSAHLRVLLEPADYKELRRLVLASRDATAAPPTSSAYGSDTAAMLSNLFQDAKPAVRTGWFKFLVKHGLAAAGSAPLGAFPHVNIALAVGEKAAASAAQQKAANLIFRRVELARSPEATAKALEQLKKAAKSNPAAASLLDRYGAATGGLVAAEQ